MRAGVRSNGGQNNSPKLKIFLESVIRPTYLAVLFFVNRFSPLAQREVAQDAGNSPASPMRKDSIHNSVH